MFQEHCTRAHIECKLRLNNSFVNDFRRNSRSPSPAISLFFISASPFERGIFHHQPSQADAGLSFFSLDILKFAREEKSEVETRVSIENVFRHFYGITSYHTIMHAVYGDDIFRRERSLGGKLGNCSVDYFYGFLIRCHVQRLWTSTTDARVFNTRTNTPVKLTGFAIFILKFLLRVIFLSAVM